MPTIDLDLEDCSLIAAALVHYAGPTDRTDAEALHAHDLVGRLSCATGLAPSELVGAVRHPAEEPWESTRR